MSKIDSLPPNIAFQNFAGCNFKCKFCAYKSVEKELSQTPLPFTLFKKIVDQYLEVQSLPSVFMSFQCEALLDDQLERKINYLHTISPETQITLTTNGIKLTPNRFKTLCASGLSFLVISYDATNDQQFKDICGTNDNIETLRNNIENIIENRPKELKVAINSMLIKENIGSFLLTKDPLLEKAKASGISTEVSPICNFSGLIPDEEYNNMVVMEELQKSKNKKFCDDIFRSLHVLANGDVVSCSGDWNRKCVLGNLEQDDLKTVWYGKKAHDRRRTMLKADYTIMPRCRNCSKGKNIAANRKKPTPNKL